MYVHRGVCTSNYVPRCVCVYTSVFIGVCVYKYVFTGVSVCVKCVHRCVCVCASMWVWLLDKGGKSVRVHQIFHFTTKQYQDRQTYGVTDTCTFTYIWRHFQKYNQELAGKKNEPYLMSNLSVVKRKTVKIFNSAIFIFVYLLVL